MRPWPTCGRDIASASDRFCPHCGHVLSRAATAEVGAPVQPAPMAPKGVAPASPAAEPADQPRAETALPVFVVFQPNRATQSAAPPPAYTAPAPIKHREAPRMSDNTVHVFDNSDDDYLHWLGQNPHSFVINTRRGISPICMVSHHATCKTISTYNKMAKRGGFAERQYIKVGANDVARLRAWARAHGRPDGSFTAECGLCMPV
jgi:hypothetical protein